jgi:hypothetical protein
MTEIGPKHPRLRDEGYLAFIRKQCCCVCGWTIRIDAAHIRMASPDRGKPSTGMQEKPDDRYAVPLCSAILRVKSGCHRTQHSMGEAAYWASVGLDPFVIADKYYAEYGGTGGRVKRKRTTIRPRLPKSQRKKIQSRGFQ